MSELSKLPPVPTASRRETVATTIRDAIATGVLTPGQKLTEAALAEQLGTSRAPIREALRQLEQEGLVISYPYRSTEVLGVSQEEIENVLVPVRVSLERYAFQKAMPQLAERGFAPLKHIVAQMEQAAQAGRSEQVADLDMRFHEHVVKSSNQPHCLQIWRSIQPRVRAHFHRDATQYRDLREIADQHRRLLGALQSGDAHLLDDEIMSHVQTYSTDSEPSSHK